MFYERPPLVNIRCLHSNWNISAQVGGAANTYSTIAQTCFSGALKTFSGVSWIIYIQLTGSIPEGIGEWRALRKIAVDSNNLTGEIPRSIGQLTQLNTSRLSDNYLRGNIPPELGNLMQCVYIDLGDNLISGPIPPQLGRISNLDLTIDYLNLSGPIPDTLGNLSSMSADRNFLTGGFRIRFLF